MNMLAVPADSLVDLEGSRVHPCMITQQSGCVEGASMTCEASGYWVGYWYDGRWQTERSSANLRCHASTDRNVWMPDCWLEGFWHEPSGSLTYDRVHCRDSPTQYIPLLSAWNTLGPEPATYECGLTSSGYWCYFQTTWMVV